MFQNEIPSKYALDQRGTGIVSINSNFEATNCTFSGLTKGVDAYTYGSFNRRFSLEGNEFKSIPLAVTSRGGYLNMVTKNRFNATTILSDGGPLIGPIEDTTYSVYFLGSQMFQVSGNAFMLDSTNSVNEFPYAIAIRNSNLGGGVSFGNNITEHAIGIQTERDNRHLLLRCDTLADQTNTDYRINPIDASSLGALDTLPDFGFGCAQGETAGNIFDGSSSYNINQEAGSIVKYYGSGIPPESIPISYNLDTVKDCGLFNSDSLNCPPSIDCWLIDCPPGGWTASVDTLIAGVDTLTPIPLRMAGLKDALFYSLLQLDTIEYVRDLLEADTALSSMRMLLPYWLETEQLVKANSLLNGIKNWQGATIDEDENSDFYDVYNIIYDLVNNGNSLHDISQQQLDKIELMAVSPYAISSAAQAILAKVQGRRYIDVPDSKPAIQPRMASQEDMASTNTRVQVYPNPTTGTINIISDDPLDYCIIHDVKGGSATYKLSNPYTATIQLDMPSGLYVMELIFKNGISETSKIILQR